MIYVESLQPSTGRLRGSIYRLHHASNTPYCVIAHGFIGLLATSDQIYPCFIQSLYIWCDRVEEEPAQEEPLVISRTSFLLYLKKTEARNGASVIPQNQMPSTLFSDKPSPSPKPF